MITKQKYKISFPHGIMFHHFHNKEKKYQGSINAKDLEELILFIGRDNLLNAEEWFNEFLDKGKLLKKVCLTFDDCLISQYQIALPVLKKFDLTAFWFPYTSIFFEKKADLEIYRYFRLHYFKSINYFYEYFTQNLKKKIRDKVSKIKLQTLKNLKNTYPFYTYEDLIFRITRDKILGVKEYHRSMDKLLKRFGIDKKKLIPKLFISQKQLKILNKNHIIGLHSHSHPTCITDLSKKDQFYEYQKNIYNLKKIINLKKI